MTSPGCGASASSTRPSFTSPRNTTAKLKFPIAPPSICACASTARKASSPARARAGDDAFLAVEAQAQIEGGAIGNFNFAVVFLGEVKLGLVELALAPHPGDVMAVLGIHPQDLDGGIPALQEAAVARD